MSTVVMSPSAPVAAIVPEAEKKHRYHVAISADGPAHFVTLGGICFPRHTVVFGPAGPDGQQEEFRRAGDYVMMTRTQAEKCLASAKTRIVRWYKDAKTGEKKGAQILVKGSMLAREPRLDDEELVPYLRCVRVEDKMEEVIRPAWEMDMPMEDRAKAAEEEAKASDPSDAGTRMKHQRMKAAGMPLNPLSVQS